MPCCPAGRKRCCGEPSPLSNANRVPAIRRSLRRPAHIAACKMAVTWSEVRQAGSVPSPRRAPGPDWRLVSGWPLLAAHRPACAWLLVQVGAQLQYCGGQPRTVRGDRDRRPRCDLGPRWGAGGGGALAAKWVLGQAANQAPSTPCTSCLHSVRRPRRCFQRRLRMRLHQWGRICLAAAPPARRQLCSAAGPRPARRRAAR